MKKRKKILGTLLAIVFLLGIFGGNTFAAESTNLCKTFDKTAGIFVGEYLGGDIDGTDTYVYSKIPVGYCFAQYVHYVMMEEGLLDEYTENASAMEYQCNIPYAVFEAKAKSIADYSGDFKSGDLGIYDTATDCMVFTQKDFSSAVGHPAFVIGYVKNGNTYDIYIQRMQMGFETIEEMEAEFGGYYDDYNREKDVFVDDYGYYHLVHRNIWYKLTATYSDNNLYFKSIERLTNVDGISMITRDSVVQDEPKGQWLKDGIGWWYQNADGTYPYSCWKQIDGEWYYFNASGYMLTGWQALGGTWYYLDESGAMVTGWQSIGGAWYYFIESGAMATGWQSVGGDWYFFNRDGAMVTGWQLIGGTWYFFDRSGAMVTGWQSVDGVWYYFNTSGAMVTGWQLIGGTWYFFDRSGAMVTGWQSVDGIWYYFNTSGAMVTGWQSIEGTWYYLHGSGAMAANQWIGNYYLQADGSMATNKWIGNYYVDANGVWVPGKTR